MAEQISLPLEGIVTQVPDVNPVFARHETFHPRFGWLKKGFDWAKRDSEIFLREDAPVRLGVGKNMVRAIRYWCSAFKVLEDDTPSEFGKKLLADNGWDEFLEDPASLWLLHWNLLKPTCEAAAWYFTFHVFRQVEFSADDLVEALCKYRDSLGSRIVDASLQKDISCIMRMYVDALEDLAKLRCNSNDTDGLIACWLDEELPDKPPAETADGKPLIVLCATKLSVLRIQALEFAALEKIQANAAQLVV